MKTGWNERKQESRLTSALSTDPNQTLLQLRELFGNPIDFQSTEIRIGTADGFMCMLKTLCDSKTMSDKLLAPLMKMAAAECSPLQFPELEQIRQEKLGVLPFVYAGTIREAAERMLAGDAILMAAGVDQVLCIEIGGIAARSIEEPKTQRVDRGSDDAFTEAMDTNLSLIRRRLRNPLLRIESFTAGEETGTSISFVYLENAAEASLVSDFRSRLTAMKAKAIYDSGSVEQLIKDKGSWFFPTLLDVERPDTVASMLVEGNCAVIVDGSPFVLVGPAVYGHFFISASDYYFQPLFAQMIRPLRHAAFLISLYLPAFYLCVINYHSQMIPTTLLYSVSGQEQGSPFPTGFMLIAMTLIFEVIREAGTRVPKNIGQAVPLAGAIILGQAAVQAGIVSSIILIVVAATELCGLVTPHYEFSNTARIIRFGLLLLSSVLGIYGVFLGTAVIVIHLASLHSFGVPYLKPFAPLRLKQQKDMVVRTPSIYEDSSK
ncbi:spore germination protein [Paenibacillus sp. HN-1]|uniref:spore germination protein n=1 Tax=Paenibacillus TaxID=44249 RepID=UPI001CA942C8|nr:MULTISPECIES: spore germination protein [Paenibacillus]MBY9078571.1 spore germination protein [Paenibacillus sp. CGMCC 1.18879]MBY9083214.1 spore germination protein [Paenibacillus sinensis]